MRLIRPLLAVLAASATAVTLSACSPTQQKDSSTGSADTAASASSDNSGSSNTPASDAAESVQLSLFAASSTRVLNEAMEKAAADIPATLTFNNGGSAALVQQIKEGAPADLLLTASKKTMDQAVADGTVDEPQTLAENVMVMVVPKGNPAGITSLDDVNEDTTFVLCDPTVPCGDVSTKIMDDKDLDLKADSLESQVADVLGKVTSGEADAGWVYSTDAAAAGDAVEVIEIPGAEKFTNSILGATVKDSEHKDAATKLLNTLADDFDSTWTEFGFTPAD
ncbi:molybdate ABC transporter substrate-binding protein [Corynebacterium phoceense]|nr:molybdate ABC transporter substrate-binding protein [Corynebacterium phoceense]MCQ9346566.1 molybdate ABC transporter substrate-binding protein [Corynebacterium phoceense]MCQ9347303.1 molybdate ABC transporter substrate-binding protein [Corynebacterium phoceense]